MTLGTILDWTVLDTGEIDGDDGSQSTLSELPFQYAVIPLFSSNGTFVTWSVPHRVLTTGVSIKEN